MLDRLNKYNLKDHFFFKSIRCHETFPWNVEFFF